MIKLFRPEEDGGVKMIDLPKAINITTTITSRSFSLSDKVKTRQAKHT
jgi:hypothetical protein